MASKIKQIKCKSCGEKNNIFLQIFEKNGDYISIDNEGLVTDADSDSIIEIGTAAKKYAHLLDPEHYPFTFCHTCEDEVTAIYRFADRTILEDEEEVFKKAFLKNVKKK
jgi:hypothetical protein